MIRNMVNRLTNTNSEAGDSRLPAAKPLLGLRRAGSALVGTSLAVAAAIFAGGLLSGEASAQGYPSAGVSLANYDLAASGFVTPAGMPPIGAPGMMGMSGSPVMPVGYNGYGCDTGSCDTMPMQACMDRMVCGTCGGGGGCSCNSFLGGGGVLGKLRNGGSACLFCRGAGCTACKELPFGYAGSVLAAAVDFLRPYEEASICNQRWYDLSVEALILDRNIGGSVPGVITTLGVDGTPVLTLDDVGADDLEAGVRVSAAMIFGVGGNLELSYLGGNEWSGTGSATSSTPNLYSFISDFGTNPPDDNATPGINEAGFDDTDRSLSQSLVARSEFHSAEFNYRRRTMFPYCRFQSSWLVGLRYIRYDDSLQYSTLGDNTNTGSNNGLRFYDSTSSVKNNLFGPQAGFDFWWNTCPGLSIGFASKAAWLQNDIDRKTAITANSLGFGATPGGATLDDGDQDSTYMLDFELQAVYRFSHSLSLRASYYVMTVDDIIFGGLDAETSRNILNTSTLDRPFIYDGLDLQGFTVGAEYMW
ncbi:BBP7 family outer membrane beta-barrel protein [Rhodopirellula sp. JC639]|uniref:BBP7 family outer membrane beta-barrel protein n=1 Tax=Stieleria mannarensis TaxID=2755585 RepID=UPI001602E474|nr:BBP7 family outer membrane beta-barrel protein [Rhodopirellula sp. JC639]